MKRTGTPLLLVLDLGTSSLRAQLRRPDGRAVGPLARRGYAWEVDAAGRMTTPAATWLAGCTELLDEAVGAVRAAGRDVAAVAVAAFWHGLVGVDARGQPLTPIFGWGDTRARDAGARLGERVGADALHERTGGFAHALYPAAKLLWLRESASDTFRRVAAWMSPAELLELHLTGARRCSYSMASGTALFDLRRLAWDAEILGVVGVGPAQLGALVDVGDAQLRLPPAGARRWPELAAAAWLPAVGDGSCAAIGSGAGAAAAEPRVSLTVGTTAAVRRVLCAADPPVPPELWCYRIDARTVVYGRALSTGGSAFAWLRGTLRLPGPRALEAALAAMKPDAHGLTVLPDLYTPRPPAPDAPPAGTIVGLSAATTPTQIARAWIEAVALRAADALDAVEQALGPVAEVRADGGALHASPAWARIFADALGRPLRLAAEREVTSRGAALLAGRALGLAALGGAESSSAADTVLAPDRRAHARYLRARTRRRRLAGALAPFLDRPTSPESEQPDV